MAATQLSPRQQAPALRALLDRHKAEIATALPSHLTAERMIRVVMTAVQRTPALLECSHMSIVGSVIQASQLGLEPDGLLGRGYLIPRRNRRTKLMEANFQPGYLGLIELAQRSGKVSYVAAELVWAGDEFTVSYGLDRNIVHRPALDDPARLAWDDGAKDLRGLRGAYAVVRYRDGTHDFEYMPKARLAAVRGFSQAGDSDFSPWNTQLGIEDMYRKCPIRRLLKRCPLSPEVFRAAQLDELATAGVDIQPAAEVDDAEAMRTETEHRAQHMRERYAAAPSSTPDAGKGATPPAEATPPEIGDDDLPF